MAAFPPTTISQNPVDLGSGFEDPMDPCTMCQQGQMEIQNAYNELTQSCNACQSQQNLKTIQSQGCQGCQQAQQVIQNVQRQSTGCASCGTQPTQFSQLAMPQTGQPANIANLPLSAGQPMLMPLTGVSSQPLMTVQTQPGVMAGQLPIAVEMGPPNQPANIPQQFSTYYPMQMTSTGGQPTMQPMVANTMTINPGQNITVQPQGNVTPQAMPQFGLTPQQLAMSPANQPVMYSNVAPLQQAAPFQGMVTPTQQPVATPAPPSQIPVAPPVQQPAPPPPIQQPMAPGFNFPTNQQIAQSIQSGINLGAVGAGAGQGYGAGGGKAGPGAAGGITVNSEGQLVYAFNVTAGPGIGNTGVGGLAGGFGPGAFDTHRPDLHQGGGWHNVLPMGAIENVFNLY